MRKKRTLTPRLPLAFSLMILLFSVQSLTHAKPQTGLGQRKTDTREKGLIRYIKELIQGGKIPGAVCLVARGDEILLHEAYGFRDIENRQAMQTNTLCWGASLMKPITVATAMTLVEKGKLGLDDSVDQYLPKFKEQLGPRDRHYPISIRQLMSHSSGLGNPPSRIKSWPRCAALHPSWLTQPLAEIVDAIAEVPLQFVPGTKLSYSNAAPFVLARVAERVSGKAWGQLVQDRILEPTGMFNTSWWPRSKRDRVARIYLHEREGNLTNIWRFEPDHIKTIVNRAADGGLFYTAQDYYRFVRLFVDKGEQLLSSETIDTMLTEQAAGADGSYGLGWKLAHGTFQHGGSGGTFAFGHPASGIVGVFFYQARTRDAKHREQVRARFVQECLREFQGRKP
jgi:CubicO group peptidase (beta-lactamase class C family)